MRRVGNGVGALPGAGHGSRLTRQHVFSGNCRHCMEANAQGSCAVWLLVQQASLGRKTDPETIPHIRNQDRASPMEHTVCAPM